MKRKPLILAGMWLLGVIVFLAVSIAIARTLSFVIVHWAYGSQTSWFQRYERRFLSRTVFIVSILSGALYASALANPSSFGGTARIVKHLTVTYASSLAGCFLCALVFCLPYPNFESSFLLSAYPAVVFCISVLLFLLGITAWVRLAFGEIPDLK